MKLALELLFLLAPVVHARQATFTGVDAAEHDVGNTRRDAFSIFNSVHHLLRQWGTAFAPNGFSYTRAIVPSGTDLYHGREDVGNPASPEWLAFDYEMSLAILYGEENIFLRHYRVKRDLNVLFIDGSSATMTTTGTLDSQDVLIHGRVVDRYLDAVFLEEYPRARELCAWGVPLGIDGFVRQNLGLELIKCKFDDGLTLLSNLNITQWGHMFEDTRNLANPPRQDYPRQSLGGPRTGRPGRFEDPYFKAIAFEWARAAASVYDGPGESRIRLQTSTFISAYGRPGLHNITSSNPADHRLTALTPNDARDIRLEIEQVFLGMHQATSDIDWRGATDQIVARYGHRLETLFEYLTTVSAELSVTSHSAAYTHIAADTIIAARMVLATLLSPHYDLTANISHHAHVAQCVSSQVPWNEVHATNAWLPSEQKLAQAIELVQGAICDTLIFIHDEMTSALSSKQDTSRLILGVVDQSRSRLSSLMNDLRWTMWKSCDRKCEVGEICFVSLWPKFKSEGNISRMAAAEPPRCANVTTYRD